ncbi:hypothetical protein ACSBR1_015956 [Camellia fascicularis]
MADMCSSIRGHNMCALLSGPLFAPTVVECTRKIYFKEWDPQHPSFPDCGNQNRLRDFIKQTLLVETKSRGRQELPSDLFTASHSSFPAPVPSWQVHPPYGMGYGMQYHPTAMSVPAFPNSAKSRNPFDLNDDNNQAQGPMPQASSYGSIPPSQIPSSGMSPSPGAFMGQQFPNNMPFRSFKALEMTDLFNLFFQVQNLLQ